MLVSSKAVNLGLGSLGQPDSAPAPGPKTSEALFGAASSQPTAYIEVVLETESAKQKEVGAIAPPIGADSLPCEL